ncbi:hypothetical protein P3X46_010915 [Hevea brasiliensis]|uniref:Serine-threonine kinase receptor-associated protein n=1 Tax=Hevea brasiliensis TaxID=3981 RepID=A0ABQ9MJ42_HEVBR|nr:hypothetical protein P3X46_010915 [Hevea brasiliensis]
MLRNGETGDWIGTFEGHKGAVWSCCLDTNALRAASASADFTAKLWDALTGDELDSFEHKHIVRACAFSEDTHLLLTGGVEKILRILDLNRPDVPPREVDSSPGSIRTVAWLHSDQTILSSCTDMGGVRYEFVWPTLSGCNKGHHGPVHCVRFSPGGESYTGPANLEENAPTGKLKASAHEIAHKLEGFHISKEGNSSEKREGNR